MAHVSIKCTIFYSISVEENCIIPFPTLYILVCRECLLKSMYSELHSGIFYEIEKGQRIYEGLKKKTKIPWCTSIVLNTFLVEELGWVKECTDSDWPKYQPRLNCWWFWLYIRIMFLLESCDAGQMEHDKLPPLNTKMHWWNNIATCQPTSDCSSAIAHGLRCRSWKKTRDTMVKVIGECWLSSRQVTVLEEAWWNPNQGQNTYCLSFTSI